jgi:hypothetical protein
MSSWPWARLHRPAIDSSASSKCPLVCLGPTWWFEHNTYWALYTTNEYVWRYSERMNWWKDQTPPGLEAAIVSAREKIAVGKPLGFDIGPLIATAGKR